MQIVLCGNRIIAHGENCFTSMEGTVICEDTGKAYQNATIAEVDTIPCDVDRVGYEYHAGNFVPCAPYGKGTGNIAVFCGDSCKALKDSGISVSDICKVKEYHYTGNGGTASISIAGFRPLFAVISMDVSNGDTSTGEKISGTITPHGGYSVRSNVASNGYGDPETNVCGLQSWMEGNTLRWRNPGAEYGGSSTDDDEMGLNDSYRTYTAVVIGLEVDSNG